MCKPHSRSDSLLFTSRSCTKKMFKLTFAFLLLVSGCWAQCTSDSCGTESPDTQMKVIMQRLDELSLENNKLKTTNQEFRTTIGGLETAIAAQETTNQQFRTTIGGLETANAELRKNISLIQTTSTELQTTNEQLQTTVANLQMNLTQLRATSTELQTTNEQLQTTVANLQMNVTQIQATSTASAAYFSVAANTGETYNNGNTIKFHVTYTNVVPAGSTGGWDIATNTYTCPLTGDYMFVVTLYKTDGNDSYNYFPADLTHTSLSGADTLITRVYNKKSSSVSGGIWFSSTVQAIVACRAGEKVWVRADCGGCRLGDNNYHYNTFSGFKL